VKAKLLALALVLNATAASAGERIPLQRGECVQTKIEQVTTRLDKTPGSGTALIFTNGLYQVSYEQLPQVDRSRPGDPVTLCLISIPSNCPPGDDRGRVYHAINHRTHAVWELPDSEHMCGGA
jgi:hypothetical protein